MTIRNDQQRRCRHSYNKPARPTDVFTTCRGCGHRIALFRIDHLAYELALQARIDILNGDRKQH